MHRSDYFVIGGTSHARFRFPPVIANDQIIRIQVDFRLTARSHKDLCLKSVKISSSTPQVERWDVSLEEPYIHWLWVKSDYPSEINESVSANGAYS